MCGTLPAMGAPSDIYSPTGDGAIGSITCYRLHHHGMTPFSSENVPVGPFASRSASRTGSRAACWTVHLPWKLVKSVAVKSGDAALTLMRVDSRSKAKATVIALSAVLADE